MTTAIRIPAPLLLAAAILLGPTAAADEGMYPISEIYKLDLQSKGLRISSSDIFNPVHGGLIDAIVQIGGCTGSFVSPEGLIITNHHCAFGAMQEASDAAHDYINDGFLAADRAAELPAAGYTVRITERYYDVSSEVLASIADAMSFSERAKAIEQKMKELVAAEEKASPGKRAEVAEMFPGESYVLFVYTYLKDVRAVYVPPRAIGEFGGEADNWMWPRHTGDFSFMRAYVAPDGSPADYSPQNVPYRPKKVLRVNPAGVEDGDAVFILGYPGRTYRHMSSHYLSFEEDVRMPYVADLHAWQIETLEGFGKEDPDAERKHAAWIKGMSNTMKNYRGKLLGLRRTALVSAKRYEERKLAEYIDQEPGRKSRYGNVLPRLDSIYSRIRMDADRDLTLSFLRRSVALVNVALTLLESSEEMAKPDLERQSPFMERNLAQTMQGIPRALDNHQREADEVFLRDFLLDVLRIEGDIEPVDSLFGGEKSEARIDSFIADAYARTTLADSGRVMALFGKSDSALRAAGDPILAFARRLRPEYLRMRESGRERDGALTDLNARLSDVKRQFLNTSFIPDANRTIRLTFGRIAGYSPSDALTAEPITTIRGLIEKGTGREPFVVPEKLKELYLMRDFGTLASPKLKTMPIALLYNLDTTDGNSGSPLLDSRGDLVGVNFDRAFEATINDYAWNAEYSRSIGVDIRYVLWVTAKFAGAGHILREMGVGAID